MTVLVSGNTPINVNTPEIGALAWGDTLTANSSFISLRFEQWIDEFTGSFQYDVFGELAGGVITGWKQTYNGQLVFEVTGAEVSVGQFLIWVANDDNATAVQTIFAGADSMTGSQFLDILSGYAGADSLFGMGGDDTLEGGAGEDYVRGGDGADSLAGGADFDDLHGNLGNDVVDGGLGTDWVVGGQGNDLLRGGDDSSYDVVYGNLGNDTCYGGDGGDWVRGGQGDDSLSAGGGADWIWGDRGNDTIEGGAGADIFFVFGEAGTDRVLDFNAAEGDVVRVEAGYTYSAAQVGADVVVSVGGGAQVVLVGRTLAALGDGWLVGG